MQLHKGSFAIVRYFTDGYYEDISGKVESVDGVYKELKMSTGMKNGIGKGLPTIIPFEDILEVTTKWTTISVTLASTASLPTHSLTAAQTAVR